MNQKYNRWKSTLKENIFNYDYYTNFNKIYKNIENIRTELNILNTLIGSKNIERDFENIIKEYPNVLKAIPLIIAVVSSEIEIYDGKTYKLDFKKANYSKNDYIKFMRKSGIFDLLEKHVISNIYDYILGIMVGLDTYSRKNRSSYYIQKILKDVLESSGYLENINVFFDISVDQIKQQFNIDLRLINLSNSYRFDAVLKKKGKLYLIECNYFSSIGSKINEIVKNNVQLSKKLRDNFDVEFMWIIDGPGCEHSKIIEEAFDSIFYIFNLHDLENHVLEYYI